MEGHKAAGGEKRVPVGLRKFRERVRLFCDVALRPSDLGTGAMSRRQEDDTLISGFLQTRNRDDIHSCNSSAHRDDWLLLFVSCFLTQTFQRAALTSDIWHPTMSFSPAAGNLMTCNVAGINIRRHQERNVAFSAILFQNGCRLELSGRCSRVFKTYQHQTGHNSNFFFFFTSTFLIFGFRRGAFDLKRNQKQVQIIWSSRLQIVKFP